VERFKQGDRVAWTWGQGQGRGTVRHVYTGKITRTIKGTQVTRHASDAEPAYLIEQADGDEVLKGQSALQKD